MSSLPMPDRFDTPLAMRELLARWARHGWLRGLDAAFADFLAREVADASPLLLLAAALASHQLGRGHACLDLADTLADPAFALSLPPEGDAARRGPRADSADGDADDVPPLPSVVLAGLSLAQWLDALDQPRLVDDGSTAPSTAPLVRVGSRLYLRRYWQYEQAVRAGIAVRVAVDAVDDAALQEDVLRVALDILFPASAAHPPAAGPDWQKLACALAARSAFSVVTGGPGTGKTTTVVRLLALLQALALRDRHDARALRIRLAAPTGKAAARLNASIAGAVAALPLDGLDHAEAIRDSIPVQVTTLHRLLGSSPLTRRLRHHAGNPLALDVLVIDEASMIDLEMMAAVLAALPPRARLVLLGDKDQLASVEAGAVLGQLCGRAPQGHYTPATRDWLTAVTGCTIDTHLVDAAGTAVDQRIAMLRHSHRFDAHSGIGQLAEAVNAGNPDAVRDVLRHGHADLSVVQLGADSVDALRRLVIDGGYGHYLTLLRDTRPPRDAGPDRFDAWARTVLTAHAQFQLLCALRRGPWGVEGLNQRIAALLHDAGLIPARDGWYRGRPVLVTRNDYSLGLMNGDIGIALDWPGRAVDDDVGENANAPWTLRVAFPAGDGNDSIKWVLPSRLRAVETVYALTVHKSQGSEFAHVALLLPDTSSPILTRELIYTGITRASRWLTLSQAGGPRILEQAVQRRVLRVSGLMDEGGVPRDGQSLD